MGEVGRVGRGGVHHHGQRGLERVGEVAGMGAGFLGLTVRMREQRIDLVDQRLDFERQWIVESVGPGGAHLLDGAPDAPQRDQPVARLQSGHEEQPEAQHDEAVEQDRADLVDLLVELLAAGGDGEPPAGVAAGQDDRALDDAQRLAVELRAVVDVRL